MNFSPLSLVTTKGTTVFSPFDRGAKGAFVYRENGVMLHAQRVVVNTATNDASSDRYSLQINKPVVEVPAVGCCPSDQKIAGTNIVAIDVRFLASTIATDRIELIDQAIALLGAFKTSISLREKLYS